MFANYGGTVNWGSDGNGIRFTAFTTSVNAPFTNINLGTSTAGLSNKTAGGTLTVGGLAGGSGTGIFSLNVDDGIANSSTTFSGNLSGATLTKVGTGTWTLNPSTAYTAATNINANGGTLLADFSNLATPTNLFFDTVGCGFTGGELYLKGLTSTHTTAQTLGNVSVSVGDGVLLVDPNISTSATLTLGTLTATTAGGAQY